MDLYLNKSSYHVDRSLADGLVLSCNGYLCIMKLGEDTSRDGNLLDIQHRLFVQYIILNLDK